MLFFSPPSMPKATSVTVFFASLKQMVALDFEY